MKKILGTFVFLLVVAAVVFFLGWTQFRVNPDSCGVLVSKTGGVNEKAILPGKFSWNWECLIPTNAKLKTFTLKSYTVSKLVTNPLPSADVYSKMFSPALDFSYRFDFLLTARVTSENIIALLKDGQISDSDSLNSYLESACASLSAKASSAIIEKIKQEPGFSPSSISFDDLISLSNANTDYPNITLSNFSINSYSVPDLDLYENAKALFAESKKVAPPAVSASPKTESPRVESAVQKSASAVEQKDERDKLTAELLAELQRLRSKEESKTSSSTQEASQ